MPKATPPPKPPASPSQPVKSKAKPQPDKPDAKPARLKSPASAQKQAAPPEKTQVRLNKAISDSGFCARRTADEFIRRGFVKVNGQVVTEMGVKVNLRKDKITVQGQPLPAIERLYLLFYKPVGYVTSRNGGSKKNSIYQVIPPEFHTANPAGRLDQDSSGAILMSNDGDFLFRITHPGFHLPKVYDIVLDNPLDTRAIERLLKGVMLLPENKMARMSRVKPHGKNPLRYQVELITGYNRQIRRSLALLGFSVESLHRVACGPIKLGKLRPGELRELTEQERQSLLQAPPPEAASRKTP